MSKHERDTSKQDWKLCAEGFLWMKKLTKKLRKENDLLKVQVVPQILTTEVVAQLTSEIQQNP